MLTLWVVRMVDRAFSEIYDLKLTLTLIPTPTLTSTKACESPPARGVQNLLQAKCALFRDFTSAPIWTNKHPGQACQEHSGLSATLKIRISVFTPKSSHQSFLDQRVSFTTGSENLHPLQDLRQSEWAIWNLSNRHHCT